MRKKALTLMLTLAMLLTMIPLISAPVFAGTAPEIEIEGITPVAGKMPVMKTNQVTNKTPEYKLASIKWYYRNKDNPVTEVFKPGRDYFAELKFTGDSTLEAEGSSIKIDGDTFFEGEDNLDAVVSGKTITFDVWFYDINVPYFTICLKQNDDWGNNTVHAYYPSSKFKIDQYNGVDTVTFNWWKCDEDGVIKGSQVLSNTTGEFSLKDFGYNYGEHYVAVQAFDSDGKKTEKLILRLEGVYDISKAKISINDREYNGKSGRAPKITIKAKLNGKTTTLKKGTDYKLKYRNKSSKRKDVGYYPFMIESKNEYLIYAYDDDTDGEFDYYDQSFRINPKGTFIKSVVPGSKKLTVKWKKQSEKMSKTRINGYQIQIATDKKFKKNKQSFKVKGYARTTKIIKGLKGGKKYYVRIRTYKKADGSTLYSKWSKAKAATVKK